MRNESKITNHQVLQTNNLQMEPIRELALIDQLLKRKRRRIILQKMSNYARIFYPNLITMRF